MSNVSIYGKKWIDLVFEDRNQMYGAYQLRQQNPKTTLLALFYGVLLMAGLISIAIYSNYNSDHVGIIDEIPEGTIIQLTDLHFPISEPEVEKPAKTTPPNTVTELVVEPINILSTLVVVETPQAVKAVPKNDDIEKPSTPAIQGTVITVGIGIEPGTNSGNSNSLLIDTGSGTKSDGGKVNSSSEVDKLPSYPGGMDKFYLYVANNFKNPDTESGSMVSVLVAFVVEKDGTLSNIKVLRNSGIGTDKEAIRVLSTLRTKWTPGIKNGEKVRTEFTLPIKVKFE